MKLYQSNQNGDASKTGPWPNDSEKLKKTMTTLLIIFVCFGLADAIGNFVVYYLSTDRAFTNALDTMVFFYITMTPLIIIMIFVYFVFLMRNRETSKELTNQELMRLLDQRLAKGEISEATYKELTRKYH